MHYVARYEERHPRLADAGEADMINSYIPAKCPYSLTKDAIKKSFLKLLNSKPIDKITVKEIVEDCGINRNSFYYHFDDIPSLMEEIFNDQADEYVSHSFSPDNLYDSIMEAITFSLENKTAILHVFNSPNRQFYDRYLNRVARRTVRFTFRLSC